MKHKADWSPNPEIRVLAVERQDDRWLVSGEVSEVCLCPDCEQPSRTRHDATAVTFRTSGQGRPVVIRVSIQRWRCTNALCRRQTFGSRVPDAAGFAAPRTRRVSDFAAFFGHAVGGRPAHRLAGRLGLTASRDAILRALKRAPQPASRPLRVVGIDDWSWRRGGTYGTLIMDLERRQVADLLPIAGRPSQLDGSRRIRRSSRSVTAACTGCSTSLARSSSIWTQFATQSRSLGAPGRWKDRSTVSGQLNGRCMDVPELHSCEPGSLPFDLVTTKS